MKVFISQPMTGKTQEEIEETYKKAVEDIKKRFIHDDMLPLEFLSTRNYILPRCFTRGGHHQGIATLSHAIQVLSMADAVYFCEGAEESRGCAVEHAVAKVYGIPMFRPEGLAV